MKNLILFLISTLLLSACEEKNEFLSFEIERNVKLEKKFEIKNLGKLKKRNQFLLDSLLSEICYYGQKVDITCQRDNAFKNAKIDNKEQKQALKKWKSSFDSLLLNFNIPEDYLYYFDIGYKARPITEKELQKRIKIIEEGKRRKFDLRIYFNKDTMIDCFGAYFSNFNIIVIYDYLDTSLYGKDSEYLAKGLLFFHEIFHADTISINSFSVDEQHMVINYYENNLIDFCLNINDYAEKFLESPTFEIDLFIKENFAKNGYMILSNISNIIYAKKELENERSKLALDEAMNSLKNTSKALSKK